MNFDAASTILALGVIGTLIAVFMLILIWYVLQVAARWRIFTKAGEPGWKSLIPFYSTYIQYKITWNANVFWGWMALILISCVLTAIGTESSSLAQTASFATEMAAFVLSVISLYKLSKAFGHGIGFTFGLLIFQPIFSLILGFGSSEYQGPQ